MNLSELDFRPALLAELEKHGYTTVDDMAELSNAYILSIAGMGGASYRRLAAALGRVPFSKPTGYWPQRDDNA